MPSSSSHPQSGQNPDAREDGTVIERVRNFVQQKLFRSSSEGCVRRISSGDEAGAPAVPVKGSRCWSFRRSRSTQEKSTHSAKMGEAVRFPSTCREFATTCTEMRTPPAEAMTRSSARQHQGPLDSTCHSGTSTPSPAQGGRSNRRSFVGDESNCPINSEGKRTGTSDIEGHVTGAASDKSPSANCDSDLQKWQQHLLASLHSVLDDDLNDLFISPTDISRELRSQLTDADFAFVKKTVHIRLHSYIIPCAFCPEHLLAGF
jgi:hypothetical protein